MEAGASHLTVGANRRSRRTFLKLIGATGLGVSALGAISLPRVRAAEKPIVVGYTLPQSGPYANEGNSLKKSLDLGVKQINQSGGILGRRVDVLVGDDKTSPSEGVKVANRLLDEGADFLIGGYSSAVTLAISGIAKRRRKIYMGIGSAANLTGTDCHRYGFFVGCSSHMLLACADWVIENEKVKTVYQIAHDYSAGRAAYEAGKRKLDKAGVRELGRAFPALGTKDFSAIVTEILRVKPDLVVMSVWAADQILLMKDIHSFGLKDKMIIVIPGITNLSAQEVGPDVIEGVKGSIQWYHGLETPATKKFWKEFQEEYPNTITTPEAADVFASLMTFFDAVKKVGSIDKTEELVEALEGRPIVPQLWNVGEYIRKCDHRSALGVTVVNGKARRNMKDKFDFFDVLKVVPINTVMQPCEETGCKI